MNHLTRKMFRVTTTLLLLTTALISNALKAADTTSDLHHISTQKRERIYKSVRNNSETMTKAIIDKSNQALNLLNDFWQGVFLKNNRTLQRPTIAWSNEPSAFYDGRAHHISVNLHQFISFVREVGEKTGTDGDLAFIAVIAHEYSHAIQRNLQVTSRTTKESELQADCLSGAFVAHLDRLGMLEDGDHDEATFLFFLARDPTGTHPAHQNAHGTGSERISAYQNGYNNGVRACGCGLR